MSTIKFDDWRNTDNTLNGKIRAWVNTSTSIGIGGGLNVSSITDAGTGVFNMNFANAMPDTNFVVLFGGSNDGSTNVGIVTSTTSLKTVNSIRVNSNSVAAPAEIGGLSVAIVR